MTETATTTKAKAKPAAAFEMPKFEMPKFEIPSFEMPKFEVPAAYREFAEKGISTAKENYEKIKAAAEGATDVLEDTYATASKGACTYGLKMIETTRANANAAFDFATEVMSAKSYSDLVQLSTAFMHKQFDTMTAQAKDLASVAQKVTTETVEPIKDGITSAMKKAA